MKLGPVVGERTWGGVVGIDGRYHLVDGTVSHAAAVRDLVARYGWGVENHGVDPDVEVVIRPQTTRRRRTRSWTRRSTRRWRLARTPAAVPPELPEPRVR